MLIRSYCLFAAFVLAAPSPQAFAQAQSDPPSTAKALVDGCRELSRIDSGESEPESYSEEQVLVGILGAGNCLGYINGFLGGYGFAAHQAVGPNTEKICIPKGVTQGQIARVLVNRLEQKPEFEHVAPLPYVIAILQMTWPCN